MFFVKFLALIKRAFFRHGIFCHELFLTLFISLMLLLVVVVFFHVLLWRPYFSGDSAFILARLQILLIEHKLILDFLR